MCVQGVHSSSDSSLKILPKTAIFYCPLTLVLSYNS